MNSRIAKLAVAAGVIIAVILGVHHFGASTESVAWGDVIKPILTARTVVMDMIIGSDEKQTVIHDEVLGSSIRRTVPKINQAVFIIDLNKKKMMTLDSNNKTAVYIGITGLGNIKNYVEMLRDSIARLEKQADFKVDNKGLEKVGGLDRVKFVAQGNNETITVWADPKTKLPVRIEQQTPNMQIVCENLQFDIPMDESRFSMEAPAGYKIMENAGINFSKGSESDFIESLRIWATNIEDGQFPDSIALEEIVKIGPKFEQGLKRAKLTDQQQLDVATRFGQGIVFIRFFKGQGQWHWLGKGVKLGDANSPIFWYQPKKSTAYRVIYGDLTVRDANDMPQ